MENYQESGPPRKRRVIVDACAEGKTCKVSKPKIMQSTFSNKSRYDLPKRKRVIIPEKPEKEKIRIEKDNGQGHMNVRFL